MNSYYSKMGLVSTYFHDINHEKSTLSKKKNKYDPFDFHQYTDFYGQYSVKNGRKIYNYCFDVRFKAESYCQPPLSTGM